MNKDGNADNRISTEAWILILLSSVMFVAVLSVGISYRSIREARISAAKANIGQIESVFLMAEMKAVQEHIAIPSDLTMKNVIKSYSNNGGGILTPYEQFIRDTMMDYFGNNCGFDFAITRYQDTTGFHITVYYFPIKGRNDAKIDQYFLLHNGEFSVHNLA